MSSAAEAIIIEDDESDTGSPLDARKQDAVRTFMEIMNVSSEGQARTVLGAVGYNVEMAVTRIVEEASSSAAITETTIPTTTSKSEPNERDLLKRSADRSTGEKETLLSPQWYECYRRCQPIEGPFVDPDFPPIPKSLDGRMTKSGNDQQGSILCCCRIPASSRTVQSDGPNYGRFYLACGQRRSSSQKQCKFFQWDPDGSKGYNARWSQFAWHSFHKDKVLFRNAISPDQVRQGAVGNCWFLSALAVVAEKPYLVERILPHTTTNEKGCYQINLCLDGEWTPVIVDSHLPVVYGESNPSSSKQRFRGGETLQGSNLIALPAFCAVPRGQLWPALVEKAYAKSHNGYAQLSGGFVAEGLADLTGAPTETVILEPCLQDKDELWARLVSFSEAGFVMGLATSRGGDGLVGGHAYSILNVSEVNDSIVGAQPKLTEFFSNPNAKKPKLTESDRNAEFERTTIRLVRIRNPWGKREWKGAWSADSENWTVALRKRLGAETFAKGDGTFFMSFDDVLERFHHMDVAKCREGWVHSSISGYFEPRDPLCSSSSCYSIEVHERTWAFLSIVQPKKRANTKSSHWYCDPSNIILRRRVSGGEWECEGCAIVGVSRSSDCEVFLDPTYEYCCLPFACTPRAQNSSFNFRLKTYSSKQVKVFETQQAVHDAALALLHKQLLGNECKLLYTVAPKGVLVCVQGRGCVYFVVINGSNDHFLSLRLTVKLAQGVFVAFGVNSDTHDVPPRQQKIVLVLSRDGKFSTATELSFTYLSDSIQAGETKGRQSASGGGRSSLGACLALSVAGDFLSSQSSLGVHSCKGGDTIETSLWIPQIGDYPKS